MLQIISFLHRQKLHERPKRKYQRNNDTPAPTMAIINQIGQFEKKMILRVDDFREYATILGLPFGASKPYTAVKGHRQRLDVM